jgi:hypothetical protein
MRLHSRINRSYPAGSTSTAVSAASRNAYLTRP